MICQRCAHKLRRYDSQQTATAQLQVSVVATGWCNLLSVAVCVLPVLQAYSITRLMLVVVPVTCTDMP